MRRKTMVAAGAAIATAVVVSVVSVASAGAGGFDCVGTVDTAGASGCFHPESDTVYVVDTKADGNAANVYWYTDYGRSGQCRNTGGLGNTTACDYDLAEGHRIYFRAERMAGDKVLGDSVLSSATV